MLEVPSPMSQCHDVGSPDEVSVNWTTWPVVGDIGLKVKEADGSVLSPPPLLSHEAKRQMRTSMIEVNCFIMNNIVWAIQGVKPER
jgi:hypothetical protein